MKVVLADDHYLLVEALAHLFSQIYEGVEVLKAASFDEALMVVKEHGPLDLALLDYNMPGMDGFSGLEKFKQHFPEQVVALISGSTDRAIMSGALDRGAAGFIPKTMTAEAMSLAIKLILAGERFVPSELFHSPASQSVTGGVVGRPTGNRSAEGPPSASRAEKEDSRAVDPNLPNMPAGFVENLGLSKRESEVLNCLVDGHSNREIGQRLGVEEVTIKLHLRRIYSKMDVKNRAQAVRMVLSYE